MKNGAIVISVIFKTDKESGEVVAFFPETVYNGYIMAYAHNGQSFEASLEYYWKCKPCKQSIKYAPLKKELKWFLNQDEPKIKLKIAKRISYRKMK